MVGTPFGVLCVGSADKNTVLVPSPKPLAHSFAAGAAFDKAGENGYISTGVLPLSAQNFGISIVKYLLRHQRLVGVIYPYPISVRRFL